MLFELLLLTAAPAWSDVRDTLVEDATAVCGERFVDALVASGATLPAKVAVRKFLDKTGQKDVDIVDVSKRFKAAIGRRSAVQTLPPTDEGDFAIEGILSKKAHRYSLKLRIVDLATKKPVAGCLRAVEVAGATPKKGCTPPAWSKSPPCTKDGYLYASGSDPESSDLGQRVMNAIIRARTTAGGADVVGLSICGSAAFALARSKQAPQEGDPVCTDLAKGLPEACPVWVGEAGVGIATDAEEAKARALDQTKDGKIVATGTCGELSVARAR